MTMPRDIPSVLEALAAVALDDSAAQGALDAAFAHPSPVVRIVGAFEVLRPLGADLEGEALAAFAGAAYLIAANGWHGKAGDAAESLLAVAGRLPAAPPAALPGPPPFMVED